MKIRVVATALLATACSPASSGRTADDGQIRGHALNWTAAPENSVVQSLKSSVERCWRISSGFDCLRVGGGDVPGHGKLFTAVRSTLAHLPKDEWEYSELYPDTGYVCQVMTERALAVEAFSPSNIGTDENTVSLLGEDPIGHPLKKTYVDARLSRMPNAQARYFDCIELGGILLAKGLPGALSDEISHRSLMP